MSKTLEDLGYGKEEKQSQIIYENNEGDRIVFIPFSKSFCVMDCYDSYQFVNMEELKAIYQYCIDNKWI